LHVRAHSSKQLSTLRTDAEENDVPTVLIVDDDADHRELLTLNLRRAGHQVIATSDAAEALALARVGGLDAALLDVRMPGATGIELCRRLRAEPGCDLLPVMLISADVGEQRIVAAFHAGADDYLTKPFRRAELYTRLDHLLQDGPSRARRAGRVAAAAVLGNYEATRLEHSA
jgi:DNA-binding response OmpR family regulator